MSYERIDIHTLAERLVTARKSAKITQETAADHLGISRPTFIAIEKGHRRPRPEELVKLSELYQEPVSRLVREIKPPSKIEPYLRSMLENVEERREEVDVAINKLLAFVDDYRHLEFLVGEKSILTFPPRVNIPPGPIEPFAEHCAQEERARLNLGMHQPIPILRKVLEDAGLHVFCDKLHPSLAGLYVFVPDFGYCMLINAAHSRERRRWTIAHEYGHFLRERDRPGVDYLQPVQRRSESERFADVFAAAFLMPEAGVRRRFYDDVDRTGDFRVSELCRMADFYAVSLMAMTLRLEGLGLLPRGTWNAIHGSRVPVAELQRETALELGPYLESNDLYPHRYMMLAVQAFNDEKISEGELASLLRCHRIRAREIVAEHLEAKDDANGESARVPLQLAQSLLDNA